MGSRSQTRPGRGQNTFGALQEQSGSRDPETAATPGWRGGLLVRLCLVVVLVLVVAGLATMLAGVFG